MKRIFPIGLMLLGALLSIGALSWLYLGHAALDLTAIAMPDRLAGLPRTDYQTDSQAMMEFENLHGKQFPLTSGAIGIFGNQQITVWAAGTASNSVATEMVNAMRDKIAEGNSPFTPLNEIHNNNRTVYVLEGMGQKHYYFQSENLVIWLAAEPFLADDALQQTLEAFP